MLAHDRKASCPLRVVVVGAGLAGLATAYALQTVGHHVLVLERSDGTYRSTGCIRSQPNLTRLLQHWGLWHGGLERGAHQADGISFRLGDSDQCLGQLQFAERIMHDFRANFYFIRHGDLYQAIRDAAIKAGVRIRFETEVTDVDPSTPAVTLASGERLEADLLVGADGYRSRLREHVLGRTLTTRDEGRVCLSFTVPFADLRQQEPDVAGLEHLDKLAAWMNDGCVLQGCPMAPHGVYYMLLHCADEGTVPVHERWTDEHPLSAFPRATSAFSSPLRKLFDVASPATVVKDVQRDAFDTWVHDSGKLVLVGEAAHPLPPGVHSSVAMAFEDAAALSNLLSRLTHRAHLARLLSAYEDIRERRWSDIASAERASDTMTRLPPGPEREARDVGLRTTLAVAGKVDWEDEDEAALNFCWAGYIPVFLYDADEGVDDWWTLYGRGVERRREGGHSSDGGGSSSGSSASIRLSRDRAQKLFGVAREVQVQV